MASGYELEVTQSSATDLKNVNWRHGPSRPYAVVWYNPDSKCSTGVDAEGDTSPFGDQALAIPLLPVSIEDQTLCIDVVHAGSEDDTKPLIGSARLKLRDVLNDAGFGQPLKRNLQLKRPSGRPHGKVEVEGDTSPFGDQALAIPLLPGRIEDQTLCIDVVHAGSEDDTKLIGSARLKLRDVLIDAGFGQPLKRNLQLKRPSGRPHGKVEVEVEVKVCVREPRYRAPPYGVRPGTRVCAPPAYVRPYPPPAGGYAYGAYDPPPQPQCEYRAELAAVYGQYRQEEKRMALAVSALAELGADCCLFPLSPSLLAAGFTAAKWLISLMHEILNAADEVEDAIVDDAAVEEELDSDD